MSNVENFVKESKKALKEILNCSGSILYSRVETLKPDNVYLLGYNPGGDPKKHNDDTIEHALDHIHETKNNYLEEWANNKSKYDPGEHPLQKRVRYLLKKSLGLETEDVCASNLIFKRSINEKGVNFEDAKICWPVHKRILNVVKPKMIIAFGTKTYKDLLKLLKDDNKLGKNLVEGDPFESGHGKWMCRSSEFESDSGTVIVVGLPHLSRYAIDKHEKVINWIKGGCRK